MVTKEETPIANLPHIGMFDRETALSTEDYGSRQRYGARRARSESKLYYWAARRRTTAFFRARFAILAALADAFVITTCAVAIGVGYHIFFYHVSGMAQPSTAIGILVSILFIAINVLRNEYSIVGYLSFGGHARRVALVWNITFLGALVLSFMVKETSAISRGSIVLLYASGLFCLVWLRAIIVHRTKMSAIVGKISALRVVLAGSEAALRDFSARYQPWAAGIDVVSCSVLRGPETLDEDLALAAASARVLHPDDIFILVPWSQTRTIDACVAAFIKVPASIHLGPELVLDRFSKASISRIGKIASLHLVRQPLSTAEVVIKRVFDVVVAMAMLIVLLPLFGLIAVAIKRDSPGPVFFMQRRYGFNQQTFRIVKFRSMTVTESDRAMRPATRNDDRVTRVGRFMRRYNIDELPQLLNVIRGDMSLVGPRPHALIQNQHYERSIAEYARRHNVRPGVTGWAQIHGLRGEITSEDFMRRRLEHDLYYIDNWTMGLDLRILGMTILSAKAFENAF